MFYLIGCERSDILSGFKVTVYTTSPPCPRCQVLKRKLDEANIKYDVFDNVDEMIKMGFESVPMMKVDDSGFLNFAESARWVNEIVKQGNRE